MKILLDTTVLCEGQTRDTTGKPIGPSNFRMSETPGVVKHEYIGADRISPEHIKCNSGQVSFDVERIFPTVEAALTYALITIKTEKVQGKLMFGDRTVFDNAVVTQRSIAHVGCAVAVSYTIEG